MFTAMRRASSRASSFGGGASGFGPAQAIAYERRNNAKAYNNNVSALGGNR
jgi:hypothetical protein